MTDRLGVYTKVENPGNSSASVANQVAQITINITSIAITIEEMSATIGEIASSSEKARVTTMDAIQQVNHILLLTN